ncbi:unnamed protein product [Auanema sp. JU1783]|nr:unnamed protein product [Auanema sp. JU1783]
MSNTNPLDSHRTLWMGDLKKSWDADFVIDAFKRIGHTPISVKMVTDKNSGQPTGYCFVEFSDSNSAREAMLNANGSDIYGSNPPVRFNLSFANDIRQPSIEYNLFANNLALDVDDADLYHVFGRRYPSCRGAKVYRNQDGSSRGLGFVRFGDQTEQQQALVEMNHTKVRGREIVLKLAAAKQRLPRSHIAQGQQPYLIPQNDMHMMGSSMQMPPPMRPVIPVEVSAPPQPPELASITYPTAEEANEELIQNGDAWFEELEESRWTCCIVDSSWNDRDMCKALNAHRW